MRTKIQHGHPSATWPGATPDLSAGQRPHSFPTILEETSAKAHMSSRCGQGVGHLLLNLGAKCVHLPSTPPVVCWCSKSNSHCPPTVPSLAYQIGVGEALPSQAPLETAWPRFCGFRQFFPFLPFLGLFVLVLTRNANASPDNPKPQTKLLASWFAASGRPNCWRSKV